MDIKQIEEGFAVSPQVDVSEVAQIETAGFKAVINNRPEGEEQGQPIGTDIGNKVLDHNMTYTFQPVVGSNITDDDVANFKRLFKTSEKPLLAFCRTGTRCTNLWALATVTPTTIDDVIEKAANAGYNISGLRPRLEQQAKNNA